MKLHFLLNCLCCWGCDCPSTVVGRYSESLVFKGLLWSQGWILLGGKLRLLSCRFCSWIEAVFVVITIVLTSSESKLAWDQSFIVVLMIFGLYAFSPSIHWWSLGRSLTFLLGFCGPYRLIPSAVQWGFAILAILIFLIPDGWRNQIYSRGNSAILLLIQLTALEDNNNDIINELKRGIGPVQLRKSRILQICKYGLCDAC